MDRATGRIPWPTVVTQIKNYAKANDNIPLSAWNGCTDTNKLGVRPDSANGNACISATVSSFPAPSVEQRRQQRQLPPCAAAIVDGEELLRQGDRQR